MKQIFCANLSRRKKKMKQIALVIALFGAGMYYKEYVVISFSKKMNTIHEYNEMLINRIKKEAARDSQDIS